MVYFNEASTQASEEGKQEPYVISKFMVWDVPKEVTFEDLYTEFRRHGPIEHFEGARPEIFITFKREDSLHLLKLYEPEVIIKGHRLNVNWLNDEVVRKDEIDFEEDQDGENELQFHAPDKHGFSEILSKFDEKVVRMFFKISGLTDCELLRYAREYTTDNKSSKSAVVRGTRQIPDICGRPIWCVENFFRNFGECVLRLGSAWLNDIQCNMASKWCPNIQELKCRLFDRETPDKMRELVARLKTLDVHFFGEEIDLGDWYGTDMQMEKLSVVLFNGALVRLPNGPLPKLKELTISHSPMNASERFFMHNLQIEKLTFVQVLDRQNPHKTQLSFIRKPIIQRYMWINTTDIVEILENLKTMQFYNELDRVLWDALTAFYRSKIPVEYVKIHQDVLPDTTEIVPFIARLKSIRRLNIKQMPLSDDDLISLSQSLNALEEFKLWSNSESKKAPKMSGVRRFVNYAEENLRKVRFIYRLTNGDYNNPLDVNELGVAVEIAQAKDIDFQVHLYSENDEIDFDKLEEGPIYDILQKYGGVDVFIVADIPPYKYWDDNYPCPF